MFFQCRRINAAFDEKPLGHLGQDIVGIVLKISAPHLVVRRTLIQGGRELGAKVLTGGFIPEGNGAFYPPTVLANVTTGMPAYHEELFGPVAVLYRVSSEEEAIRIANDTVFGLGAGVFTADIEKGKHLAEMGLEAGCVFVNDFVKSDPRLPFGGVKESGYGRELSAIGIREFMNIKTIVVK